MPTNVYLPDGSKKIVVPDADVPAKLAEGYITQDQYMALEKERAQVKYQEWLASPDTVAERFQMLRQACESKLAATDYAMNTDFPISETSKTVLLAYRKAIRQLNHQDGAPWDGGGELTPWPDMPTITKITA